MSEQSSITKIEEVCVEISCEDEDWQPYLEIIEPRLKSVAAALNIHCGELSVVLTDDARIQEINKQFRNQDKPTNVLSFPSVQASVEDTLRSISQHTLLGDIVLSYQVIDREAMDQNKSFEAHLVHLLIHGFLHLLGYDHAEDDTAEIMEQKEIQLLDRFGIENPYLIVPSSDISAMPSPDAPDGKDINKTRSSL
jgi:probable rRNA maturation factor